MTVRSAAMRAELLDAGDAGPGLAEAPQSDNQQDALAAIFAPIACDFAAVNQMMAGQISRKVNLIEEIGRHIIQAGGKRLRPALVLLATRCCGYRGNQHVRLAAIIEYLHTATLLHDDVVDRSNRRRGLLTANARWGNVPAVLVGDFLYSRAFQWMVALEKPEVLSILADATNLIAQGEVMQFTDTGKLDISEARYMEVIRCKTALLFQASAQSGAVLADATQAEARALTRYGTEFGLAYQLIDDWLDYAGDDRAMGKNAGDDLAEGKVTLPLILTMNQGAVADQAIVRDALQSRSSAAFAEVREAVQRSGALDRVQELARLHSHQAVSGLTALPPSPSRSALSELAEFALTRIR